MTQELEKSCAELRRCDPADLQLGLKAYLREAEEEDFFDAVLLALAKKLAAAGPADASFPREAFEQLCSLAWDEKLFRALTREVRAFFQDAAPDPKWVAVSDAGEAAFRKRDA